ncbi:beta-hexosaminidase-like [Saccostrea echinata]|uniref:beta-hexosaminidase-like n=1 Tax=Saccostrea echinata TaxID=191078 RepID=UPI002A8299C5|nr:beta-hexosaminidase-like [Saccostrea echinata]
MDQVRILLLLVFAVVTGNQLPLGDQSLVDYIAETLDVKFDVISNFVDERRTFTSKLTLKNTGSQPITPEKWEIYFFAIRLVQPNEFPYDDGLQLNDCKMKLFHVAGSLYKLCPMRDFLLSKKDSTYCELDMKYWQSATTDTMPNWYVVSEGMKPRDIISTQGEGLSFVGPFNKPEQYKRYTDDDWQPFSPEVRYDLNAAMTIHDKSPKPLIPTPVEIEIKSGNVTIDSAWIVLNSSKFYHETVRIAGLFNISIQADKPKIKYIEIVKSHGLDLLSQSETQNEAYSIEITSETIHISATTRIGAFYAYQTLKSLATGGKLLPLGTIKDQPRFAYRGMHLDVGRNFHTKATVLKILDTMAMYKLNKFHFHLTEDEGWRLEIPGLPELTKVGSKRCHDLKEDKCLMPQLGSGSSEGGIGSGFYTVEDYKEILRYANDRHIQVIPEFDMPGHCRAGIKAMEAKFQKYLSYGNETAAREYLMTDFSDNTHYLTVQWFTDNAINICMESTETFIRYLIDSIINLHKDIQPLEIYHFGGDEVAGAWIESPECREFLKRKGLHKTTELKKYFAQSMAKMTDVKGLQVAAWADGLMIEGQTPYNISDFPTKQSIIAYNWDNLWERGHGDKAYKLANAGYKVVLSHATHLYFDHPQEPDPSERGYYWATRFTDTRKTFGYIPSNISYNADKARDGHPLTEEEICPNNSCFKLEKPENIIGVQGQIWTETIRTEQQLQEMLFPRMLALAELAWHKSTWEEIPNKQERIQRTNEEWTSFASALVEKELSRLENNGIKYRIPVPGARLDGNKLLLNTALPGLKFQYSDDNVIWKPIISGTKIDGATTRIYLRTRSVDGSRYSRTITMNIAMSKSDSSKLHTTTIFITLFAFMGVRLWYQACHSLK